MTSQVYFCLQAEAGIRDWSVTGVQTCALFFTSRSRHTRLVSDWSSDVCSSDLGDGVRRAPRKCGGELGAQPIREDRAENRRPDRAADRAKQSRPRGRDPEVRVVDGVLDG